MKISITTSFGTASYPMDTCNVKDLIETADAALYASKRNGHYIVSQFQPNFSEISNKVMEVSACLDQ
jgi:GGDEF domain-containing protein